MTVREMYQWLNDQYPPSLSLEWDKDGLMVCPNPEGVVTGAVCALDVTDGVIDMAIQKGCNVIVSHHPLLFRPLGCVTPDEVIARRVLKLIQNGISVMCFHTRADAQNGGVNDLIVNRLGLLDVETVGDEGICRVGNFSAPKSLQDVVGLVKGVFGSPCVMAADAGRPIFRLAVCGGSGNGMMGVAKAAGADALLAGTLDYHTCVDAPEGGITLLWAGHFYTEYPIVLAFAQQIREQMGIPTYAYEIPTVKVY